MRNKANLKILFCFVVANICRHRLPKRIMLERLFGLRSFSDGDDDGGGGLFILGFVKNKVVETRFTFCSS